MFSGFELAQNTFEVPPVGVYCYDLSNQTIQLFPWYDLHDFHIDQLSKLELTVGQTIQRNEDLKVYLPWLSLINIKVFQKFKNIIPLLTNFNIFISYKTYTYIFEGTVHVE